MTLRGMLLASAMIALPLAMANAQPVAGPYISLGAGLNIMQDESIKTFGGMPVSGAHLQTDLGGTGVVAGGWGFGNGVRAEFEFDYRYNGLNKVTGAGGSASVGGSEQKFGPMVNVLYDFTTVSPSFVPYVGLGAGYQWARLNLTGSGDSATDTKGAFAYQAILGAGMPIASVPGLSVTAEYRFLGLAGDRTYGSGSSSAKFGDDYNHSILVGLRYAFGQAPEAPPPAPMPMADMGAKTFLVFFDWNKADLTARSSEIVKGAAEYSKGNKHTRIDVDGNADTSGTATYNQGLSEARAHTVAAELVRDGVPRNEISIHAFGDTKLLVPTGPNTREPQNRRVEIVFH